MNIAIIVNPTPSINEFNGVDTVPENEGKTDDELFQEAYDECEATDIRNEDVEGFIVYCENLYNMKTADFLKWYEKRNYEGNIDMQLWALYAKNRSSNGMNG